MNIKIEGRESEPSTIHVVAEIVGYVPHAILSKTILKRNSGNITASSFDAGQELDEKRTPYDTYVQIIEGSAELSIMEQKFSLKQGEGIIIPAHARHGFNAQVKFKMVTTIIKNGEEDGN